MQLLLWKLPMVRSPTSSVRPISACHFPFINSIHCLILYQMLSTNQPLFCLHPRIRMFQ